MGSLSADNNGAKTPTEQPAPQPEQHTAAVEKPPEYNAMASVIERHEAISNRVRSAKK